MDPHVAKCSKEEKDYVEHSLLQKKGETQLKIKAYKRRWTILIIFFIYSAISSLQWIEYSSITHLVVKYYKVSTIAVDWTSIVYMAVNPFLVIPASYIIDKKGLRTAGLIGCIGTAIGTGIKVFSVRNDLFVVVLIGQTIISMSQVTIICLPPKIAAVWFKSNEVSTACSIGAIGMQIGCAIGYILPPSIVKDSVNLEDIGAGLYLLCWILAGSTIPVTVAVLFYFSAEPPLPPSNAQANLRQNKEEFSTKAFFLSIKKLFQNKPFVIHMVAYGINIAVFSAVGTLWTQFVLQYFEGASEDAGRMGFIMVIVGALSSIVFGILLDKTRKYKEITFLNYLGSAISIYMLMYALEWKSMLLMYISTVIVGVFTSAYMPVGFEFAMELTFPSEESTTTGILIAMTQVLGAIFTVAVGYLNLWVGCYWSLFSQGALLILGTVFTGCVPNKLLQQEAFKQNLIERKVSHHGSHLIFIE
ncbi:uncharacterized MFS-type transporter C09D4.1-like [Anoplophora glabripennis]|uniref:uncharacterized MFS-type transporter C09D4.1-like n=1 Tax=Anoplophora glabripennis TaxID=217634 RepID=UPI000873EDD9|nr:uncharacterized MFS-type transporter C09D4.1-like [Anoplophora glabripennis]